MTIYQGMLINAIFA